MLFLAQKGKSAPDEIKTAEYAIKQLGGLTPHLHEVLVPSIEQDRYVVEILKQNPTPSRYPRRVGMPAKRPLVEN